ncbi:Phosphoenolpyruvate synthase [Castellaniella defragrans 65Phen]|uniref:Phosphoenolpyruvate synthase n=2 Tax=Castellaniella defragrans TaxID=75697 RepID=W8WXG2_CASD6|nr:Phosphoenolpyruvate synthase [Castellaniella defragrans 65Phen]
MISQLAGAGVRVPGGFATTAEAFRDFLKSTGLDARINARLDALNADDVRELAAAGAEIRQWVIDTPFPADFERAIRAAFAQLDADGKGSFAVRSSATAEDLPDASFAGQQETYLNVVGIDEVLDKIRHVFASLYNDRAISYRVHKGYAHAEVALSAGIQRMVRSDKGSAGVMFTLDTESGFKDVVFITSSYGLGETVVQGAVNPDEFYVFKPTLASGHYPVISRRIGSKLIKMEFDEQRVSGHAVRTVEVPASERNRYSLSDEEIIELARYATIIEAHYQRPMDIEWGRDGVDGKLYILQARPETVKSQQSHHDVQERYRLKATGEVLITGRAIGQKIGSGTVRVVADASEMDKVRPGDILVTDMTDPNWEPVMKLASAIVTNRGGRTCHAAIIARELGIPAVVGCADATDVLANGREVTVSCAEGDEGRIYDGLIETEIEEVRWGEMPDIGLKIMMNVGNPQLAFDFSQIPNGGVGLARLEFIINNNINVHPKAILDYPNVDSDLKKAVESAARGYASPRAFFVEKLAEGVATIGAAFYPKPVIVRLSDFKSNEYRKLVGGSRYEPEEENPMLGFRGASRYISEDFAECFRMECEALKKVRDEMGLTNVEIMVPFVRTLSQARRVVDLLASHGLKRGENGLRLIMMCEVPTNAILADEFLQYFDGFSIGSNDMTQLTLGLDRDSGMELLAADFDERDPAVQFMLRRAIQACLKAGKYVGICGQGPSDHPDLAQWLRDEGILSMSLNPDTVVDTWQRLADTKIAA